MKSSEIPAFPIHPGSLEEVRDLGRWGMTLRDYFAVHLLAGMMANPTIG
jgi:hypothetical protein